MNRGYVRDVAVAPFTPSQRQRMEALTLVRSLYPDLTITQALKAAHWVYYGAKP